MRVIILCILIVICSSVREADELRISKRLAKFRSLQQPSCGNWMNWYTLLHNKMLHQASPRILVAIPHRSGMADRIVGLTTAFMMAILTERAFQIGRLTGLPDLELAFTSPYIDWSRAVDPDWLTAPLVVNATQRNYNTSYLLLQKHNAVNTIENDKLLTVLTSSDLYSQLGDAETVLLSTNRGRTIVMFENRFHALQLYRMELNRYTAFGCLFRYLMEPRPEIFLSVQDIFMKMTNRNRHKRTVLRIAIQIRIGDEALANNPTVAIDSVQGFFDCAQQIEKHVHAEEAIWYLVSDSLSLRHAARQKYKKILTALPIAVEHSAKEEEIFKHSQNASVSVEGFRLAAAEWYLMSFADYHVITTNSGFGRSAAMLAGKPGSIYSIANGSAPAACGPAQYSTIGSLGKVWSGI